MNGPTTGTVRKIWVEGSGQNSGQVEIRLGANHGVNESFFIFMQPPDDFFKKLRTAFDAMWGKKPVEITSKLKDGDQEVVAIQIV